MAAPMPFSQVKKTRLKNHDLSKKGSVDEEIVDLINYINDLEYFCTTSSCSGRIIVICEQGKDDVITKKGCQWLYVSHQVTDLPAVENSLKDLHGSAVLKFEPFILHVQCRALEDAKLLHMVAVESGFRNSGITVGKAGKVMVAVRSTHGLEVPLSNGAELLVSSQYLAFLVQQANSKLGENFKRIARFHTNLVKRLDTYTPRLPCCANSNICKQCGRTKHQRWPQSAQDTGRMDTDQAHPVTSGYRHPEGSRRKNKGEDFRKETLPAVQAQCGEPTSSTLYAGQEDTRTDNVDPSGMKTV